MCRVGLPRVSAVVSTALALLVTAPLAGAANQVSVVDDDPGPGVDYSSIDQAISLAGEGDIILVRSGSYTGAHVTNKSVSVIGDPQAGSRPIIQSIKVDALSVNQRVVFRGVDVELPFTFGIGAVIELNGNLGAVVFEDVTAKTVALPTSAVPALRVANSRRVMCMRCEFEGGAAPSSAAAAAGVFAQGSGLALYESIVTGGEGADSLVTFLIPATDGGVGLHVDDSEVLVAGSVVTGGIGGDGGTFGGNCVAAGAGGVGTYVEGANSVLRELDPMSEGGTVGAFGLGCPPNASSGVAYDLVGGAQELIPDSVRTLESSSPGRDGQSIVITMTGQPGEARMLLFGAGIDGRYKPSLLGALGPAIPLGVVAFGVMPGTGTQQIVVPLPGLPAGFEGADIAVQMLVGGITGTGLLSSPSILTVVDASL